MRRSSSLPKDRGIRRRRAEEEQQEGENSDSCSRGTRTRPMSMHCRGGRGAPLSRALKRAREELFRVCRSQRKNENEKNSFSLFSLFFFSFFSSSLPPLPFQQQRKNPMGGAAVIINSEAEWTAALEKATAEGKAVRF